MKTTKIKSSSGKSLKKGDKRKSKEKFSKSVHYEDRENDERYEYNETEGVYVLKKDINDDTIVMDEDEERR